MPKTAALATVVSDYERFEQPTDYLVDHEKDTDLRLEGDPAIRNRSLRCPPLISGALRGYDPAQSSKWGLDGWRRELDDERAIGFDLLWLSNTPAALASGAAADPLKALLDLCADRKVQVILDTGTTAQLVHQAGCCQ